MEWKVYLLRHNSVELLLLDMLALEQSRGHFRARSTWYDLFHMHTMLHMAFSTQRPYLIYILNFTWFRCNVMTIAREEKRLVSLHYSALTQSPMYVHHLVTSFHVGSILSQFASHIPVAGSQKPSRSRSFCGGALNRGDEGLPYAFRRLLPHPRLFRVLTPVMGLVPLAYLHNACKIISEIKRSHKHWP